MSVDHAQAGRDIIVQTIVQQAARYTPGRLHQLHAVPAQFVGREQEIAAVVKQILDRPANGRAAISAICGVDGLPGVGKTELANLAAHALAPHFPDAQLFISLAAHSPAPRNAKQAMEFCLTSFDPDAKPPDDDAPLRAAYLSAFHGKRCLLLLDDARDDDQIEPLLPPPGCAVIVTSRARLACSHLDPLDTLPPIEAAGLLRHLSPRLNEAQAGSLAELCGCLPIALSVAGGHLNRNRSAPVEEFIQKLSGPERLKNLKLGQLDVQSVFEASYAALVPEQQTSFRALAVMTAGFDRAAALAVVGKETEAAATILDELAGRNLLGYDEKAKRFRWHDLLREFARNQSKAEELDAAQGRHAKRFICVADRAGELFLKGGENVLAGLALFDRERGHLEAAFDWLESGGDKESAPLVVSLVDSVANTSDLRFHPSQRIRWLEAQVRASRLAGDRQAEATALGNLGLAHALLGDARKAIEFHEQALVIDRETDNQRGEGDDLGNLGQAYYLLGDTRKAIEFHKQQLIIDREIGDRRGESNALGNLGLAYVDLGEVRKAIKFYEQALIIDRETGDRRGEGSTLGNLGIAYKDLGDAHKAIEFYEQQLVIVREIGDRRGEANAFGSLGVAHAVLGDARKAIEFYEQALLIAREMGDRRGEGADLGNIGVAHKNFGDARKAIEFYEQALVIDRKVGDRRGEGSHLWNSALALEKLGDRAQAISQVEAALRIFEAIEDPNAPRVRAQLAEWRKAGAGS